MSTTTERVQARVRRRFRENAKSITLLTGTLADRPIAICGVVWCISGRSLAVASARL